MIDRRRAAEDADILSPFISKLATGNNSGSPTSVAAHDLSGTEHTGTLIWSKVNKSGASLSDIPNRSHSLLSNLNADDHAQYVHISTARTITARHTFNPASAASPFILGANAQGQTVVGLKADQLNRTLNAGAGDRKSVV